MYVKKPTDIIVEEVACDYEDFAYRTPIKFGGVAIDRVTILNVNCTVRTVAGARAAGFGSMPLGNVWSFPSRTLSYDQTLAAMKALARRIASITAACNERGHPLHLNHILEPAYIKACEEVA